MTNELSKPSFLSKYVIGFMYIFKGFSFLRANTSLIKYLIFPLVVSMFLNIGMVFVFLYYSSDIVNLLITKPADGWFFLSLWYVLMVIVNLVVLLLMLLFSQMITSIISSPFYDLVSRKIESIKGGNGNEIDKFNLLDEIKIFFVLLKEELKKALFVTFLPLIVAFIPIVGPFLSVIIMTVFIAWEYVDYSLSRNLINLKERLSFVFRNIFYFLGFGSALMIPVLNIFLFPFAICGASLLSQKMQLESSRACEERVKA